MLLCSPRESFWTGGSKKQCSLVIQRSQWRDSHVQDENELKWFGGWKPVYSAASLLDKVPTKQTEKADENPLIIHSTFHLSRILLRSIKDIFNFSDAKSFCFYPFQNHKGPYAFRETLSEHKMLSVHIKVYIRQSYGNIKHIGPESELTKGLYRDIKLLSWLTQMNARWELQCLYLECKHFSKVAANAVMTSTRKDHKGNGSITLHWDALLLNTEVPR